jgi:chemotaxis signal transduction protein
MEYGGRLYGLVVDEILNVGRIDASQAQAPPAEGMTGDEAFITGVVASDLAEGRLVLLLDAAALAGAEAGLLEAVQ